MSFFLIFSAHFDRDKGLDFGRLSLNDTNKGTKNIWIAASSTKTRQKAYSIHERGGFLPPQYRCHNLPNYFVDLKPIKLKHIPGVRGNFYKILPFAIRTDKGGRRSDFGIHWDADYPGSMGCIVMSKDRFRIFEEEVETLKTLNILSIPLFVQYS